jgi:hypothetical protein
MCFCQLNKDFYINSHNSLSHMVSAAAYYSPRYCNCVIIYGNIFKRMPYWMILMKKCQRYLNLTYQEISIFHSLFREGVVPISCSEYFMWHNRERCI